MGIKTVPHRPYSPDLAPSDFWLFPKLRGCRYETIEEMKEAVTKVIDTLTQEDFHGTLQKLLELYNYLFYVIMLWIFFCLRCSFLLNDSQNFVSNKTSRELTCQLILHKCPGYDTKLYLMVNLQPRNDGECGLPLHYHYSQVHSDLEWKYLSGSHLCVKLKLFNHLLKIISYTAVCKLFILHRNTW